MKRLPLLILLPFSLSVSVLSAAGLDGAWIIQSKDGDGRPVKAELTFREEAGSLKGELKAGEVRREIASISQENGAIAFEIPWEGEVVKIRMRVAGDAVTGEWSKNGDVGPITGQRIATRPQGIGGVWKLTALRPNGETAEVDIDLKQADGAWSGTMRMPEGGVPLRDLSVTASEVNFQVHSPRGLVRIRLKAEGGLLKGDWTTEDQTTGAIEGRR